MTAKDRVQELQELTERLWAKAGLGSCARIAWNRQDDGSPHVEVVGKLYTIVITERGRDVERISLLSAMEVARWFAFQMAAAHAQSDELRQRKQPSSVSLRSNGLKDDGYSRWNWMAPTVEIMERISSEFGAWAKSEYGLVLQQYPLEEYEIRNARYPLFLGA